MASTECRRQRAREEFEKHRNGELSDKEFTSYYDKYHLSDVEELENGMFDEFGTGMTRQNLRKIFNQGRFDLNQEARTNYLDPSSPNAETMQVNTFSNDGRVIIADNNNAKFDGNPPESRNRWKTLVFDLYKEIMADLDKGTDGLQFIGRNRIKNLSTKRTLKEAIKRVYGQDNTEANADEVFLFRANAPQDSEEAKAFNGLSWSDKVNGVWWMLADFYQALGKKKITAIHGRLDAGDPA